MIDYVLTDYRYITMVYDIKLVTNEVPKLFELKKL